MNVTACSLTNLQVEIIAGRHQFVADEPVEAGGDDAGPDPYSLLLGSLAACTVITLQMYARRKSWPLESVQASLGIQKVHARDCEDCESDPDARVDIIESRLTFRGDLSPQQVARLAEIASRCPVHRTLAGEIKIRTGVVEG